jgi:predicted MFS family arabinose efflux permease
LPFFLLGLPAGALADLVNRRHLVLAMQLWMMSAALMLGFLTLGGHMTAWLLLALMFLYFIGTAVASPAWNAITPELVQRPQLEAAIALGSAGYNMARGVGAALGGVAVAYMGPGWVFIINAVTFVFMVHALWRWSRPRLSVAAAPPEKITGAIKAGLRYVRHTGALRSILIRTVGFAASSAALWSLVPLLARQHLGVSAEQYGWLVGFFGIGTLAGAVILPRIRHRASLDGISAFGTIAFALGLTLIAIADNFALGCLGMCSCGAGWTIKNSALNVGVQMAAPSWARARVLSVYLLVFFGSTAFGSLAWGWLATWLDLSMTMLTASLVLMLGMSLMLRYKLSHAESLDLVSSGHWHNPKVSEHLPADAGPVMITVEYLIDPARAADFVAALRRLEVQRRRDGAIQWYAFRDVADGSKYSEMFLCESWGEHMRQHERVTRGDRLAEQNVDSFHIGPNPPRVVHFVAADGVLPAMPHTAPATE